MSGVRLIATGEGWELQHWQGLYVYMTHGEHVSPFTLTFDASLICEHRARDLCAPIKAAVDAVPHGAANDLIRADITDVGPLSPPERHLHDLLMAVSNEVNDAWKQFEAQEERESQAGETMPLPGAHGVAAAARLAGPHRPHLHTEWAAMLAGERGEGIARTRRIRLVLGFLRAALCMRAGDLSAPLWRPADWLLSTQNRTNTVSTLAVGALVVYIHTTDGLHTLLTEGWAWCAGCGVAVRMLLAWLRRVRGIELASCRTDSE